MVERIQKSPVSPDVAQVPAPVDRAPATARAALGMLVGLVFVAAAGWIITQGYRISFESAEAHNIRVLRAFDHAAGRFFGRIEPVVVGVADDFFRMGPPHFAKEADRLSMPLGIVDAAGGVVAATDNRVRALLVQAIRQRPALFQPPLVFQPPRLLMMPVATGQDAGVAGREGPPILIGWRVSGAEGAFAVVAGVLGAASLRAVLAGDLVDDRSRLALMTSEGDVLLPQPGLDADGLAEAIRRMLPPGQLIGAFEGAQRERLEPGGPEWRLAFHGVAGYPVVVAAAMTGDQVQPSWRARALIGTAAMLALLALVGGLASLHLRAVSRVRRDFEGLARERSLKERRSAERLLAAERLTHLGHWEHDLLGSGDYWSAETYHILRVAPEREVAPMERLRSVILPADRDLEREAWVLALTGVKPYDIRVRIVHPDGAIRHVQLQAEVLRDDAAQPVKLIGTILDVTERAHFESRLRESEERYRKTFEAAQDALFLVDRETGRVIDANSAATRLYGHPRSVLLGLCWEQVVGGDGAAMAGPARHRRRDGTELFVDLSVAEAELAGRAAGIVAVRDVTARMESEARLVRTTKLLTDAERIAHLGYWDWDRLARTHHWSEEHWRLLGLDPTVVRPGYRTFIALVHPEDRVRVTEFPLSLGGHGDTGTIQFRIIRPDGETRQLSTTVRVERTAAGEIARLFAIQKDVTAKRQAEIALAESHATLLSVVNATQEDSVMLVSADGIIQVANNRAARSFGCATADLCGRELRALIPRDSWALWQSRLDQVAASTRTSRFEHSRGGIVFDAHLSPALSHSGRLVGIAVFERDVTARKQVEINLRLLTRAIEQSPLSVVITDREGRIVYVNPHFVAATGYAAEFVIGKDPSLFKSGYTPPDEYHRLWDTITSGQVWQGEFHNRMKNGDMHGSRHPSPRSAMNVA